jgi:glutamate racemase
MPKKTTRPRRPANHALNIGVFDSGMGGLTVLKELIRLFPHAHYQYFGDTARLPYGSKSVETVAKYARDSARFLEGGGAELLVVACNTATALALDAIQEAIDIPVIGVVEPGALRAAEVSRSRKVAVIATEATVASHAYKRALSKRGIQAREKACPLFVPLVEEGWTEHRVTRQVAEIYLNELLADDSETDVLLLGCTHYPLLSPLLRSLTPERISIVDSAESTASAVMQHFGTQRDRSATESQPSLPKLSFFATDSVEKFQRLGERFLGQHIEEVKLVRLKS